MKKFMIGLAAVTSILLIGTPSSHAASKKAATLKCPSCGMPMATVKSAAAPIPVKVHGKTYYCCAGCASGKKAAKAMASHSHMHKM